MLVEWLTGRFRLVSSNNTASLGDSTLLMKFSYEKHIQDNKQMSKLSPITASIFFTALNPISLNYRKFLVEAFVLLLSFFSISNNMYSTKYFSMISVYRLLNSVLVPKSSEKV